MGNRFYLAIFSLVAVLLIQSCGDGSGEPLPPNMKLVEYEQGLVVNEEEILVPECQGIGSSNQNCTWSLMFDGNQCGLQSCDNLVIMFSGGEMNCNTFPSLNDGYGKVSKAYAKDIAGFITARACTFEDRQIGSHTAGAKRVDILVNAITSYAKSSGLWNGQNLLISGISTGASAPTVAMANTPLDEQSHWTGTQKTGVCMLDGTYDPFATISYLENFSNPLACTLPHDAICKRFNQPDSCTSNDLLGTDAEIDKILDSPADNFSVQNWKLVECGSELPACGFNKKYYGVDVDWVPKEAIESLCVSIDSGFEHSCEFYSMPFSGHSNCFWEDEGIQACKEWFKNL